MTKEFSAFHAFPEKENVWSKLSGERGFECSLYVWVPGFLIMGPFLGRTMEPPGGEPSLREERAGKGWGWALS
jgi:hypothetical protein